MKYLELGSWELPRCTNAMLKNLEKQLAFTLPESYKATLRKCNGGRPLKAYISSTEYEGTKDWVDVIFGVDAHGIATSSQSRCWLLSAQYRCLSSCFPKGYFLIGSASDLHLLAMRTVGKRRGAVCILYNDGYFLPKNLKQSYRIRYLAYSFDRFIELLVAE